MESDPAERRSSTYNFVGYFNFNDDRKSAF